MHKRILFTFICQLFSTLFFAQAPYPADYFASPVKYDLTLVGNFGEIRPNHLHAGFDIKTNGKEGLPIYAVADGYVSRIKIGPKGYGKALYITHPNGYTSVYAHLQSYHGNIGIKAKNIQYSKESFEIDSMLNVNELYVKKGDLVALSGNTGSSEGPHLHFEIRDTKTEAPINPYFFGYAVKDNVKPGITGLSIYPLGKTSTVNGKPTSQKLKPLSNNLGYYLNKSDSITVHGDIGFGIECFDTETGSSNNNSVFSIEVQSRGKRIFYSELEKFTFENSRYVNAHIDYAEKQKHNAKIQKLFLAKNNQLGIYKDVVNNGVLHFTDDAPHWIKFIVKDYAGNTTEMIIKVKSTSKVEVFKSTVTPMTTIIDCLEGLIYDGHGVKVDIPAFALYDDLDFKVSRSPALKGTYSMFYHIQDDKTALQKPIYIEIEPDKLPESLQSKAFIISINNKGKRIYEGGVYFNGRVCTQTKVFGNFAIAIDTIAPVIKPVFKVIDKTNVDLRKAKSIFFKATDNLSGIKKYRATVDGGWVLCEYDFKRDLMIIELDANLKAGKHTLKLEVTDEKNNTSRWLCMFIK